MIKYRPVPLESIAPVSDVQAQIDSGNQLTALLLAHGYIESYLREWLFIIGAVSKSMIPKKVAEQIDRTGYVHLLRMHLILGSISHKNFILLSKVNEIRNKFVHELVKIDMQARTTISELKKGLNVAVDSLNVVHSLFIAALDERQKQISN